MKKVLLGLSNKIVENSSKIKVWSESFRKYSDGDIVLLVANATEDDIQECKKLNIDYRLVEIQDTWYINHKRLLPTKEFLISSNYDIYLITDVFDVLFQSDPFQKFELDKYDLFFTSEGIKVNEEPWNGDVIIKVFGSEIETCRNTEIVCSGIIAGKRNQLIDLYDKMYTKCESGTNNHNVKDQAALILLLSNNQIDNYKIFNLNEAWAMHCATSGPTEFFKSWGMEGIIKSRYNVPTLVNEKICTEDGVIFDIVHQFNRIPEWKEILTKLYV